MLNKFKGAMIGAAIGDALGMPWETLPPHPDARVEGYCRAPKWHPNALLSPGSYTDDTQIMLIAARLFADDDFSSDKFAAELKALHAAKKLRFPDGTVTSACEHMTTGNCMGGIASNTTGCVSLGLPFALVYESPVDLREHLVQACSVTHTHPAAHAAAISFAMLISATLHGQQDPLNIARKNAALEDMTLGARIGNAIRLEKEGISLDAALTVIGNDVSVYHTLPIAYFLIARYGRNGELLEVAPAIRGNSDTVGFICGAWLGAAYGTAEFTYDLFNGLERREEIETLAEEIYNRYSKKD